MQKTSSAKFYDIHCHAMNLSHPNLIAFISRTKLHKYLFWNSVPLVNLLFSGILTKKLSSVMNLLSVMENDMGTMFRMMEEDIKPICDKEGRLVVGEYAYNSIVLTPLMMDFGIKDFRLVPAIHYRKPPRKPIVEQVLDLFNGIKDYGVQRENRLFEIYPFLGLNTNNYSMTAGETGTTLPDLLNKYFGGFEKSGSSERPQKIADAIGRFDGNIDNLGVYAFAGIKLYPPLGFDPWPDKNPIAFEKVNYLYAFCSEKGIPIATHCSDGGFITHPKAEEYASPERWRKALERHPELKVNFAHLGKQEKFFSIKDWRDTVLGFMAEYPNVYADFSYCAFDAAFYRTLRKLLDSHKQTDKIRNRLLFGSDFMINLLSTDSYGRYVKVFKDTGGLTGKEKNLFCSLNPERFIFGSD